MVLCMWVRLCVGVRMYVCSGLHVRPSLSLNPELMDSASLDSHFAPGNQFLLPECWVIDGCHDCLGFKLESLYLGGRCFTY